MPEKMILFSSWCLQRVKQFDTFLCFTRTPRCFSRQSGQSLALGPWSLWISCTDCTSGWPNSRVYCDFALCAEGQLPLAPSRWEAGLCLCTVCYQYSLYPSCDLVDLAVLFSVVQRPVLNCIKLYRLCKKKKSWMLHSKKRKAIPYRWQSDLKWKKKKKCRKEV